MTNKREDDSWMHKDIIDHPGFEDEYENEYNKIIKQSIEDKFTKAYQIEMAKHHDPDTASREARKNLEADSGFYDSMGE